MSFEGIPDRSVVVAGLDLSSTTDLSCLCLRQPLADGVSRFRWRFWIPEDRAEDIEKADRVPYSMWRRQGHITCIPGAKIDQTFIEQSIMDVHKRYRLAHVAYDPWHADNLATRLEGSGVKMVPITQGYAKMSAPSKEFIGLILERKLLHDNNPVAGWCANNVEVATDTNGNIRPVRPEQNASAKKIDAIIAAVLTLAVEFAPPPDTIYSRQGVQAV